MSRCLFECYIPDSESIRPQKSLRFLGKLTHDPNLWYLSHYSVPHVIAARLFATSILMLMQMLPTIGLAAQIRSNLLIPVGSAWLTNPTMMSPVFYCTYKLGAWLIQVPPHILPDHLTQKWISQELSSLWWPLLLGSVMCGIIAATPGYALTMLYWRWQVQRS